MTENDLRQFVVSSILGRLARDGERREEALRDVLGLTVPNLDDAAARGIAGMVPQLPESVYAKWAGMFADKLMETVPPEQVRDLCRGTEESDATLALVYVMFMESERMEKVVARDLADLGLKLSPEDDGTALVGAWLKRRMTGAAG